MDTERDFDHPATGDADAHMGENPDNRSKRHRLFGDQEGASEHEADRHSVDSAHATHPHEREDDGRTETPASTPLPDVKQAWESQGLGSKEEAR